MKKLIVCGSAAILMTGLTVSVFTTAEPRDREYVAPLVEPKPMHDTAVERYVRALGAGEAVATDGTPSEPTRAPVVRIAS